MSTTLTTPQDQLAERLTALTGGKVRVAFEPDAYVDSDAGAKGHQWSVSLTVEAEEEIGLSETWLDDREPEPLKAQVVEAVRGWAAVLAELADQIEG
jgi:hypothetical protein